MKKKRYIVSFFILFWSVVFSLSAKNRLYLDVDTSYIDIPLSNDSMIYDYVLLGNDGKLKNDSALNATLDSLVIIPISYSDSVLYKTNFIFVPLIFYNRQSPVITPVIWSNLSFYNSQSDTLITYPRQFFKSPQSYILKQRANLRTQINNQYAHCYHTTIDKLPDFASIKERKINYPESVGYISILNKQILANHEKLKLSEIKKMYWRKKMGLLLQFSQNYISSNWYQGGNSNLALLSIFNGQIMYDNFNNIQWENKIEWRAGFNSVEGDTLRKIASNDDLLRYSTKLGIKAFGKWYYSVSGEVSTQLFDNFRTINSKVLKARLLTPLRVNVGLGMDFKYKKIASVMVAPFSFKYIYANDIENVNPNLFGIEKGKNQLSEIGSSFKAQASYQFMLNWQIDSRLTFFTNYKKIESDWEIVNNFTFNRYISARLMLNPRYDNTVIEKGDEKASIQFKQLLSIGLSLRFI